MQDDTLLTQYAQNGSQAAFSQLVARHLTLVYATCLREIGSPTQAEDATQVVFLLLARKAKSLHARPSLAGWLYQTARFVAKDVRKQEVRRQRQEQIVMQEMTHHQETTTAPEWERVEPLLNDALSALKPGEREAVLLRFLEGRTLAETGSALGLTEDAARMRVTRAVENLRRYLTTHGAAITSLMLIGFLTSEVARPVSAQAATTMTQGTFQALSGTPTASVVLLLKGVYQTMKLIKVKVAALVAVFVLGGAALPPLVRVLAAPASLSEMTLGEFYGNQPPPVLEALVLPDAVRGQSAMAGGKSNLQILTFTSPSSFKAVCDFYTHRLLPPGSKLDAVGVEGNLEKQSGYSLDEQPDVSAATFTQRTANYSISVSVHRGVQDKATAITVMYGQS